MDGVGTSSESSTHTSKERPDSCEKLSENVLRQRQSRAGAAGLAAEKPRIDQKDSPLLKLVKFAIAISSKLFKKADDKEGAASEQAIPAHMHMLYGELYDFTEFWQKHPGGEIALGLGVGRDATRLFESYHVFNDNHIKVMSKYKVSSRRCRVHRQPICHHVTEAAYGHSLAWSHRQLFFRLRVSVGRVRFEHSSTGPIPLSPTHCRTLVRRMLPGSTMSAASCPARWWGFSVVRAFVFVPRFLLLGVVCSTTVYAA